MAFNFNGMVLVCFKTMTNENATFSAMVKKLESSAYQTGTVQAHDYDVGSDSIIFSRKHQGVTVD